MQCWKCGGSGTIPKYKHVENGRCFACGGDGVLSSSNRKAIAQDYAKKGAKRGGKVSHLAKVEHELLDAKELVAYRAGLMKEAKKLGMKPKAGFKTATLKRQIQEALGRDGRGMTAGDAPTKEEPKPTPKPKVEAKPEPKVEPKKVEEKPAPLKKRPMGARGHIDGYEDEEEEPIEEVRPTNPESFTKGIGEYKLAVDDGMTLESISQVNAEVSHGKKVTLNQTLRDPKMKLKATISMDRPTQSLAKHSLEEEPLSASEKKELGKKIASISSRLNESHLEHIQNPRAFLREIDATVAKIVKDRKSRGKDAVGIGHTIRQAHKFANHGLEGSHGASMRIGDNRAMKNTNNNDAESLKELETSGMIFTPEETFILGGRASNGVVQTANKSSIIEDWYNVGSGTHSFVGMMDILKNMGITDNENHNMSNIGVEFYDRAVLEGENRRKELKKARESTNDDSYRSSALKLYYITQLYLKGMGTEEITLHRGVKSVIDKYDYMSAESWSKDPNVAEQFATKLEQKEGQMGKSKVKGTIMEKKFSREQILFADDIFDFSNYDNEAEYVPMASAKEPQPKLSSDY